MSNKMLFVSSTKLMNITFFQAWALNKVIANKSSLKSMIQQLNDLVHRDQFSQSLATLSLLDLAVPKPTDGAANNTLPQASVPSTKYAQVSVKSLDSGIVSWTLQ
jgi:hypothetical protein